MNELILLEKFKYFILTLWLLVSFWGLYVSTLRVFLDRVRAGITSIPDDQNSDKLLGSLFAAPNHERPYHVESAFLSSLQIILGTTSFIFLSKQIFTNNNINLFWCFGLSAFLHVQVNIRPDGKGDG